METMLVEYTPGPVAKITINNPPVNLLSRQVIGQLHSAVDEALSDERVRVITVTGAGERAFSAGADVKEFVGIAGPAAAEEYASSGQALMTAFDTATKPVIAAINGVCLGAGNELAMACHFRIAARSARFGQPEIKLGIIPGFGGTQRLPRLIKRSEALRLILTGDTIDAEAALRLGLVDQVVEDGELMSTVEGLADHLIESSATAVAAALTAWRLSAGNLQDGLAMEAKLFGQVMSSADAREGISAFLEKRRPRFTHRP